jgi:hypothetical protein
MHTTYPNGVVLEDKETNVPLYDRPHRYNGIRGSRETVYGWVNRVVAHPFANGHQVRIGKGKVVWTVTNSGPDSVSLVREYLNRSGRHVSTYRTFEYNQLTRLNFAN